MTRGLAVSLDSITSSDIGTDSGSDVDSDLDAGSDLAFFWWCSLSDCAGKSGGVSGDGDYFWLVSEEIGWCISSNSLFSPAFLCP